MPSVPPWANREIVWLVPSGKGEGAVLEVGGLLERARCLCDGLLHVCLGGGDLVDRQPPEVSRSSVGGARRAGGVVDDPLGAGALRCELGEGAHGGGGFAAGAGHPVDVEDDAAVDVGGAHGDDDELGAPDHLAGALDVQFAVRFWSTGAQLSGLAVELRVAGPGARKRVA